MSRFLLIPRRVWSLYAGRLATRLLLVGTLAVVSREALRAADATGITSPVAAANTIPKLDTGWVSTWGGNASSLTNNGAFASTAYKGNNNFNNQTLRLIVHTSLGGKRIRVRLSNDFGTKPLVVGAVHVAISTGGASMDPSSSRELTFGGNAGATIPPGAPVLSDFVDFDAPALTDLAVSIYLPGTVTVNTAVASSQQTNYVSPAFSGDNTASQTIPLDPVSPTITQWPLLTDVEVRAPSARTFVALGSSVTLAVLTTPNANARWTDVLARRLQNHDLPVSVVNASVIADSLLYNSNGLGALARMDSDVFARPGAAYVFINDILGVESQRPQSTPADIIGGLRQYIARAHTHNVKAFAGTIIPLGGGIQYSADFETKRQAVNDYIRNGGELDGYVDFDAAVRDPSDPTRILPAYDGGDHHHPNDAGNIRMAKAFDLALFQ